MPDSSPLDGVTLHLVENTDDVAKFMRWLGQPRNVLAIDTETEGFSPYRDKLRLVQFGDTRAGWAMGWEDWRGVVLEVMRKYEGPLVYHNVAFDARFLELQGGVTLPKDRTHDTMTMAHITDPLGSGALKVLSDKHVDRMASAGQVLLKEAFDKYKWDWKTVPINFPAYWNYSALDTVLTAHIFEKFYPDCGPGGKYSRIYDLEMAVRHICSAMERNGSPVDVEYSEKKRDELRAYEESVKAWGLKEHGISLGSNLKLGQRFDELGAPIEERTESGQPKVDKHQLAILAGHSDPVVAQLANQVLSMKKAGKLASAYFSNFVEKHIDGVLHPQIRTLAARTSRMSISEPALQQLPKGDATVRRAFVPSEGHSIIACDYSQIEMRLMGHFSEDPQLIEAFLEADRTGGDFFVQIGRDVYDDSSFSKEDSRRGLIKNCVPLSTEILTKRGWLRHDEVIVGDETLGYDFETKTNRWTKVTGVHLSPDAEVFRIGKKNRGLYGTYDHRWIADNGRGGPRGIEPRFIHAYEFAGTENRLILSAQAEDGDSGVTDQEASILGWVFGDGSIKRSIFTGRTSQGLDGRRTGCQVKICQTKKDMIEKIDNLLVGIPHRKTKSASQTFWSLDPNWSRELLNKLDIRGKNDFDPWKLALSLSDSARRAMARALDDADGKRPGRDEFAVVQGAGMAVVELCVALGYLMGRSPNTTMIMPDGKGWQRNPIEIVRHNSPTMTGQKATMESVGVMDTWCVSTELSSWTARQSDGQVIVTGNTMYGKAYGAGPTKMAESAGVPVSVMRAVVDRLDATYPGIKGFMAKIEDQGVRRERIEGQGYVMTPYGRRLPCDARKVYTLTNYLIQGHAAEVFKQSLVQLDLGGYGDFLMLPVHDEAVLNIPNEMVKDALVEVPRLMENLKDYRVPLTVEIEGPFPNWGVKYHGDKAEKRRILSEYAREIGL